VTHQGIDNDLVFGFTTNRLERVTEDVEVPVAVDAQGVQVFPQLRGDWVTVVRLVITAELLGDERELRVGRVFGLLPFHHHLLERRYRF